jgi:hypothetical protein
MIPKSGYRFSEKIMLKERSPADCDAPAAGLDPTGEGVTDGF